MPTLRIGISGWRYEPWRRKFYPKSLVQKDELKFASRQLNSIEINGSFYSLQSVKSWQAWAGEVPDDFIFSVKGARFITHIKRLRDVEKPLANFFAQGLLALGKKLGPILWQFPPNFQFKPELLENFFALLPRDFSAAAVLAKGHDSHIKGPTFFEVKENLPIRHAMEIRHESFHSAEFVTLLRRHNVALVIADTAGKWPQMEEVTSEFIYARLHGEEELYASGYTAKALDRWAQKIREWQNPAGQKPRDVFVYFDNDVKVRSPYDALALAKRLADVGGFVPVDTAVDKGKAGKEKPRKQWPGLKSRTKTQQKPQKSPKKR